MPPRRAANFTPPPRRPESSPAITLFVEPEDPIRIMGEMIRDADLIHEKLRGLAFADEHYRADLRVILGVAVRTKQRCARLLGEAPTTVDIEGTLDRLAEKIVEQVDEPMFQQTSRAIEEGVSEAIDDLFKDEKPSTIIDAPARKPPKKTRADRVRNLGGPAAVPVPAGVRASILKLLARHPATSIDLAKEIGGLPKSVYSTLTMLRGEGLVVTKEDESDGQRKNFLAAQAATA